MYTSYFGDAKVGHNKNIVKEVRYVLPRQYMDFLGITNTQVIDKNITNESVYGRFNNIPAVWHQI